MFQRLIFDACEAQGPGGIEAHRLEIPTNDLKRRYAASSIAFMNMSRVAKAVPGPHRPSRTA
jgi:hypothetical protein